MSKNILLVSVKDFKELTATHTNTDEKLIRPELKAAQDIFIRDLTGPALYDKLLTLVQLGTLKDVVNVNYLNLVNDYLVDALINYTMYELPDATSYQFTNKGVAQKTGESVQTLDKNLLDSIKGKYKIRAEHYAERARVYLVENSRLFPEYNAGGSCGSASNVFSCPFNL